MQKITKATITHANSMWDLDNTSKVHAEFDDGTSRVVVTYYPDEISFKPEEFIGLTEEEARQLHREKDLAYLKT